MNQAPSLYNYSNCMVNNDEILIFGGITGDDPKPYTLQSEMYSIKLPTERISLVEEKDKSEK